MTMTITPFAQTVRAIRQAKRLQLCDVAHQTGISAGVLSMIERGVSKPALPTLYRLAHALGVVPAELLRHTTVPVAYAVQRSAGLLYNHITDGALCYDEAPFYIPAFAMQDLVPARIRLERAHFAPHITPVAGDQLIFGLAGQFSYEVDSKLYKITPGTALFVRGDIPRGPRALHSASAEYLICYVRDVFAWLGTYHDLRQGRIVPLHAPKQLSAMQRIAWRIRHTRKLSRLAQTHISLAAGLSKAQLGQIETGRCVPSLDSLTAIAQAMNKPVAIFLDGEYEHMLCAHTPAAAWQARIRARRAARPQVVDLLPPEFVHPMFVPRVVAHHRAGFAPRIVRGQGQLLWLVVRGRCQVQYQGEIVPLATGDIFYADATRPHGLARLLTPRLVLLECSSLIARQLSADWC